MVSINPTSPVVTPASSRNQSRSRQVAPAAATGKRDQPSDASNERRRRYTERRARHGSQRLMDRRLGAERRRSRIDLSV